jgi:hypothetical protein
MPRFDAYMFACAARGYQRFRTQAVAGLQELGIAREPVGVDV